MIQGLALETANEHGIVGAASNFVEILRFRALHDPNKLAYGFLTKRGDEEEHMTYGELDRRARAIGACLQSFGLLGERVLLMYPPGLDYVSAFFGCLYAGAIAVPAYPPRPNQTLSRILAITSDAQATCGLTTSEVHRSLGLLFDELPVMKALRWLKSDDIDLNLANAWEEPLLEVHSPAYLQYTSGSTNDPKGVMISQANLMHNSAMIQDALQETDQTRILSWLPMYHDMGLVGNVLQSLYLGATCMLMSPTDFLMRPILWLDAISRHRSTVSGAPNFAYDLCVQRVKPEQLSGLDLSSWSTAFVGAEPVRYETLKRFAKTFEPCGFRWEAYYPGYGLAEGTLFVSGGFKSAPPVVQAVKRLALESDRVVITDEDDEDARLLVGCGRPWSDQDLAIVDPESLTKCDDCTVGEVWVSSGSVSKGYWGRPNDTNNTFQGYVSGTGEGPFLRTGDLGFIRNGELYITGRIKDLIIIAGRNHYPEDIELTVEQSHPSVRPNGCAAFSADIDGGERLVILAETEIRSPDEEFLQELRKSVQRAVSDGHDLNAYDVLLIKKRTIPRTSSGKIQRHICRLMYMGEGFETVRSE